MTDKIKTMNRIRLTKEHKEKIIEMCKKLFPETPYVAFYQNYDSEEFSISNYYHGEKWDENKPQLIENFHWFEFCITHLMLKFYWNDYEKCKDFLMRCLFQCEQPHPVDYLYNEFLKLNL